MSLNTKIKSLFFLGFFVFAFFLCVSPVKAAEHITNFDSQILIEKDGGIVVTEKISYDFDNLSKHGIYRDVDLKDEDGNFLSLEVLSVVDESGKNYPYSTSKLSNETLRVKIGDPDITVTGIKNYYITYKAYNAIRVFEDHDELYWNVTGNGWDVAIDKASATVTLSGVATSSLDIRQKCFTGVLGSKDENCTSTQSGLSVIYNVKNNLKANEGLTIVFGIPHGLLQVKTIVVNDTNFKELFFSILFPIFIFFTVFVFFIIFIARKFSGVRKPRVLKNISIVAEYEPPQGMRPIDIGYLVDKSVDGLDVSATIVDLAVRGYLKIKYVDNIQLLVFKTKDFELEKLKPADDKLSGAEKIVFEFLFGSVSVVRVSELAKRFGSAGMEQIKKIQNLSKDLKAISESEMQRLGYLDKRDRSKAGYRGVLMGASLVLFGILFIFFDRWLNVFGFILFFIFFGLFLKSFSLQFTEQGIKVLAKIFGFKEFLEVTEKDRIKFFNSPSLQPETFEKFLPYAMVLKVEKEWAEKFKDIYVTQPNWYDGGAGNAFNSQILATNLILFNTSFNRSIATGNSSSGFSGGSSGGGSGGGGGGSW